MKFDKAIAKLMISEAGTGPLRGLTSTQLNRLMEIANSMEDEIKEVENILKGSLEEHFYKGAEKNWLRLMKLAINDNYYYSGKEKNLPQYYTFEDTIDDIRGDAVNSGATDPRIDEVLYQKTGEYSHPELGEPKDNDEIDDDDAEKYLAYFEK